MPVTHRARGPSPSWTSGGTDRSYMPPGGGHCNFVEGAMQWPGGYSTTPSPQVLFCTVTWKLVLLASSHTAGHSLPARRALAPLPRTGLS